MSVRKRAWTNIVKGQAKTAWVVGYVDTKGTRGLKTFRQNYETNSFAVRPQPRGS